MHSPAFERKLCDPADLAARVAQLPQPRVFTNGCFDILHRGHVTYLAEARALGASLIVGVNSDDSVRRQGKGGDRPINTLENRMALLAALESVSLVTWFDADTPLELILSHPPRRAGEGRRLDAGPDRRRDGSDGMGRQRALDPVPASHLDHRTPRTHPLMIGSL